MFFFFQAEDGIRGRLVTGVQTCALPIFKDEKGDWVSPVDFDEKKNKEKFLIGKSEKMSKSKKNVVDPDLILNKFGADTARLFMLSDSPPEKDLEWTDTGIKGAYKYLNRLWDLVTKKIGRASCRERV